MKEGVHTFSMQIKDANAMSWAILFSIIVAGLCGVHGLGSMGIGHCGIMAPQGRA